MMKILLSNDDGYNAPGLTCLAEHLKPIANITIIAPDRQRSATGHAVTLNKALRIKEHAENYFSVTGTPADAIKIALLSLFKKTKPDLIISGINFGGNIGEDITYSGTVAAAIEGTLNNIPSIAISLVINNFFTQIGKSNEPIYFETAAKFITQLIEQLDKKYIEKNSFLNINVPNIPFDEIKGYEFTSLGERCYGEQVTEQKDPYGKPMYWLTGTKFSLMDNHGTDASALINKKISITPLSLDFTDYTLLEKMKKKWSFNIC